MMAESLSCGRLVEARVEVGKGKESGRVCWSDARHQTRNVAYPWPRLDGPLLALSASSHVSKHAPPQADWPPGYLITQHCKPLK
jgi:hypothetical protein